MLICNLRSIRVVSSSGWRQNKFRVWNVRPVILIVQFLFSIIFISLIQLFSYTQWTAISSRLQMWARVLCRSWFIRSKFTYKSIDRSLNGILNHFKLLSIKYVLLVVDYIHELVLVSVNKMRVGYSHWYWNQFRMVHFHIQSKPSNQVDITD